MLIFNRNIMKLFRYTISCVIAVSALLTTACNEDEPENPMEDIEMPGGAGQPTVPTEELDMEELIKENISVTSSYYDYFWTLRVESTIENAQPGKTVEYLLGMDGADGEELIFNASYLSGNRNQSYAKSTSGGIVKVTLKSPFWYTFLRADSEAFTSAGMYYASYSSILAKPSSERLDDEKNALPRFEREMHQYEIEAQWMRCILYVKIGGKSYKAYYTDNLRNLW